jgi:hypothetical protein
MGQLFFIFLHFDEVSFCDLLRRNPETGTFSIAPKAAWGANCLTPLEIKRKFLTGFDLI